MQEFAVHDDDNQFLEIPEGYEIDTENYRYSLDENTNFDSTTQHQQTKRNGK